MGMQGVTVMTASGDDGTGNTGFFGCKKFDPTWPASSPYVTSVGGTSLEQDETGWKDSGGGFSSIFQRPNYQDVRVGSYIKTTKLPDAQYFNVSGRGTPDVAALATNYRLLTKGAWGCLSGTSAATPVFSGLISLINDELVAAGKPTVGFINPTLYQSDGLGFDVLEGENTKFPCRAGFIAQKGWDAVTGLGTPLMENLKKILIAA
jgi:tripeptidyl-peptidase-1